MFHGSMVAIITPMLLNGEVDFESLIKLIEWHISEGTDGIVVIGTTGEFATLTPEEQTQIIKKSVAQVEGRVPIIAGTGTNSTAKTIALTKKAMDLGVDACLVVTPYYNKPTQEGLFQHYQAVANAAALPIILYNVPGRTSVDMQAETVIRLSKIPNIVGIKEATGLTERAKQILQSCQSDMDVYSGDDATAFNLFNLGAKGVISVTANVAPKLMHLMCSAALQKDFTQASAINEKLMPLHQDLFVESNPIPVKWALEQMGLIKGGIRLPLTPLDPRFHSKVQNALSIAEIQFK